MAKIKNMGTATMRFKEGIILTGSAGETSNTLIVSGTSIFKDDMQMDVNKRIYFDGSSVSNGPYIYGNTTSIFVDGDDRIQLFFDKDIRVADSNGNNIVHITDPGANDNAVYYENQDITFFVSGAINSLGGTNFGGALFTGDIATSGTLRAADSGIIFRSGSQDLAIDADNDLYVAAGGGNLSFKVLGSNGNVEFQNAVTSSHFKVEGTGGQFVAFNEDTVKLKHVNWYSSNDRQYGQGQLWYQQWFGAVEPSDAGDQGGRRIGFFFHKPNKGASDASGGSGAHPTNTHMYLDLQGMTLQTGSLDVQDGPIYFEDFLVADLSISGLDLQTDTNAYRFNCPYNLTVEGLQLYLDQHTTSGDVTVTVTNTTDTNQMISLSVTGTNTSASTTSVSNQNCDTGDVITFAITATPANAQGLRANLQFRRRA